MTASLSIPPKIYENMKKVIGKFRKSNKVLQFRAVLLYVCALLMVDSNDFAPTVRFYLFLSFLEKVFTPLFALLQSAERCRKHNSGVIKKILRAFCVESDKGPCIYKTVIFVRMD
jgi:hypothetical protein